MAHGIPKATKQAATAVMFDEVTGSHYSSDAGATFLTEVRFKLDNVAFDSSTGQFVLPMAMREISEQQWAVITEQFGLAHIPDYLRDDLCRMVFKHRILEELQSRIIVE